MRWATIFALGLSALALAGCGGGGNNASSDTTTTTTTETTTTGSSTTTSGGTTTTETTTTEASGTPNFSSGKCRDLAVAASKISQRLSASGASGNVQDVAKEFQAFVAVVPSEIKGDVQTIADSMKVYADALKGVDLSSGQTPSAADLAKIQSAASKLDQPKLQAAYQHLDAWAKKNCS